MSSPRAPDWTIEEFDTLVNASGWTTAELASRLPGRTVGGIEIVRAGVHQYHQAGVSPLLSRMMKDYLGARPGTLTCAVCKTRF